MVSLCSLSFTWKIANFSGLDRVNSEFLQSPKVRGSGIGGPEFFVNIRPWGFSKFRGGSEDDADITIHLWVDGVAGNPLKIKYSFSLLNDSFVQTNKICDERTVTLNGESSGFHNFITRRELFEKKDKLLPGDTMTIFVELVLLNEIALANALVDDVQKQDALPKPEGPVEDLPKDLLRLFRSGEHADRTFVVGGVRYAAHSAILAARSPALFQMFADGVNEVEVPKIKSEVFESLLQAIYTETMVENLEERAEDILRAADMFCLTKLKHRAEMALIERIGIQNVARLLLLAFDHDAPELKERALKFLIENRSSVKGTPGWKELFRNPEVMFELFATIP